MLVTGESSLYSTLGGYWSEVAAMAKSIDLEAIEAAALILLECQRRDGIVYAVGNGGSAATASHFACDLAKGTRGGGAPTFRVVALTDNMPVLTAWANDISYENVFAEQLASLARPGDVLVAISVSGTSPNMITAAEEARTRGVATVGLTGRTGGTLAQIVDLAVRVPSDSMEVVEDAHLIIAHSLCVATRKHLANDKGIDCSGRATKSPSLAAVAG